MIAVVTGKAKPFYTILYVQVLAAIAVAVVLGHFWPAVAVDMKPLGDGFIKLIKMVIALAIFCTVVSGISGMSDMKKVSRVGGKALIYFEVVSTLALLIGFLAAHVATPGAGFNVDPATLDAKAVAQYAGKAKEQTVVEFILNIIPNTVIDAFARGDILPIVLVSVLFGFVLSRLGDRAKPVKDVIDAGSMLVFGAINVVMRFAPLGAFGAMAFTVGRYGIASLGPLVKLVILFYIKEEILIVLGTSSSDPVLPSLMEKLERLGCSKPVVGLVVPTGYVFNTDGSSIYMTLAALFVAQATNTDLSLSQQIAIFAVAMLTSKGASGVTGASFIALVGTLSVVPTIPVAGMALILGIDRFMSEARALVNVIGNGVATIAIARSEGELDSERMDAVLSGRVVEVEPASQPYDLAEGERELQARS
jgi:aerobic C4-dicarboxylate transport protein